MQRDETDPPPAKKQKKTLNACQRCRNRKIKCSGEEPCRNCTSRNASCVFEERGRKIVVSEDYLQELQSRARSSVSSSVQTPRQTVVSPLRSSYSASLAQNEIAEQISPIPTVVRTALQSNGQQSAPILAELRRTTNSGSSGRQFGASVSNESAQFAIGDEYRRLGHSSSWSFSRRIRSLMHHSTGGELHDEIPIRDGAYGIPWTQNVVDLSGIDLPTEEYAEYLTNTLSLTLHPLYHLFDKAAFLVRLRQFYTTFTPGRHESTDLWHIQMLVVFAFGYSILAREAGPSGPTGAIYIAQAIKAMPDNHRLHQEPVISIEILCMLALFMQAMDMRLAAYQYIGQALRIGLAQGMNRRFDAYHLPQQQFEHRSNLWWTVYIIDRKLSSLVGVPTALHDEDIALPMPRITLSHGQDSTFALHVELSSQMGQMLNVVYGLGLQRQLGAKFVSSIQSILQRLADTAEMLNTIDVQKPKDTISRTAASLHLLHHQCTILAIRPVLFFLLERKLTTSNGSLTLAEAVIGLLRVCVESAIQVLKIIEALRSQRLIDYLLPFDLDTTFAAAFVLVLVDIITPATTEQWDLNNTFELMDEMLLRGIVTAKVYKKDLVELNECRRKLKNGQFRDTPQPQRELPATDDTRVLPPVTSAQDFSVFQPTEQDLIWAGMAMSDAELGVLDSATIQHAIDSLNFPFLNDASGIEINGSDWMWESSLPDGTV